MNKILKEAVDNYINNDNIEYAIMINGLWGSGKTYFFNKYILNNYDNMLYISLNGISTVEEINEKLYYEILKNKTENSKIVKKVKKFYNNHRWFKICVFPIIYIYKLLKYIINKFKKFFWYLTNNITKIKFGVNLTSINKKDFVGIINLFDELNKYIIVVDDVERCLLNVESLFGFLNNLIEQKHTKCILICNEEEIDKNIKTNYELKLLSCLNEKIAFPKNEKNASESHINTFSNEENTINLKQLNDRINYVYDCNNNYKLIKEKLVGKTFYFKLDENEAFDNIISLYKNKNEFILYLKSKKQFFLDCVKINDCNNVRTLKIILDNFYNIYIKSNNYINEKYKTKKELLLDQILKNCIFVTISNKEGNNVSTLLNGTMCATVSLIKKPFPPMNTYFVAFDFVNDYIKNAFFNVTQMKNTLEYYMDIYYDNLPDKDPYYILDIYWEQEDCSLIEALEKIADNINNGKYNYKLFPKILLKVSELEKINFESEKLNLIISNITKYLEDNIVDYIDFHNFFPDQETANIYNKHADDLRKIIDKTSNKHDKQSLQNIYESKNWGVDLYNYVKSLKNIYNLKEKKEIINYSKLISNIEKSNNKNIFYFKYTIDILNEHKFFNNDDIEKINLIIDNLSQLSKEIKNNFLKSYSIDILIDTLKKTLRNI